MYFKHFLRNPMYFYALRHANFCSNKYFCVEIARISQIFYSIFKPTPPKYFRMSRTLFCLLFVWSNFYEVCYFVQAKLAATTRQVIATYLVMSSCTRYSCLTYTFGLLQFITIL